MLKRLSRNELALNIVKLMSGTALTQLIAFCFQPLITRIYSPSNYGQYAAIFAIVTLGSFIITLCYDRAIAVVKNLQEAIALTKLTIIIAVIVGSIAAILIFNPYVYHMIFGFSSPWYMRLLSSLWLIALGINIVLLAFCNYLRLYGKMASRQVLVMILLCLLQALFGVLSALSTWLVISHVIASLIGVIWLFCTLKSYICVDFSSVSLNGGVDLQQQASGSEQYLKTPTYYQLLRLLFFRNSYSRKLLAQYAIFPKYQLLGVFFDAISLQIILLIINRFLGAHIAGQYALASKVLIVPISLITINVSQVFYQEFAKGYNKSAPPFGLIFATWRNIALLAVGPLIIIILFANPLFSFIFGTKWLLAGYFARYLAIITFFIMLNTATAGALIIMGYGRWYLSVTFAYFIIRVLAAISMWQISLRFGLIFYIVGELLAIIIYNVPLIRHARTLRSAKG